MLVKREVRRTKVICLVHRVINRPCVQEASRAGHSEEPRAAVVTVVVGTEWPGSVNAPNHSFQHQHYV